MLLNARSWNKVLIEDETNKGHSIFQNISLYDTCTKISNICKNIILKNMVSKRFIKCIEEEKLYM